MNNNQLIGVSDLNEIALPAADLLLLRLVVGNELIGRYQTAKGLFQQIFCCVASMKHRMLF